MRECKLHSHKRNGEIKNQRYITETFPRLSGIDSQQNYNKVFRSSITDSWCPCDGTCPRCMVAKDSASQIQTKIKISDPSSAYELEADKVEIHQVFYKIEPVNY